MSSNQRHVIRHDVAEAMKANEQFDAFVRDCIAKFIAGDWPTTDGDEWESCSRARRAIHQGVKGRVECYFHNAPHPEHRVVAIVEEIEFVSVSFPKQKPKSNLIVPGRS
ncbi:MAG: hypothetical protein H8E48_05055 [Chloroflexi bacterium]|nr:hypothetical protein [Chloroflexota bacterium]